MKEKKLFNCGLKCGLPSSIEMSYKVKILRQTGVAPAHREHVAILTLCNCY